MYKRDCKEGTKVVVVMGLTRTGSIIKPFWHRLADDGSYGDVGKNDVFVKWDDGTRGYISCNLLQAKVTP